MTSLYNLELDVFLPYYVNPVDKDCYNYPIYANYLFLNYLNTISNMSICFRKLLTFSFN